MKYRAISLILEAVHHRDLSKPLPTWLDGKIRTKGTFHYLGSEFIASNELVVWDGTEVFTMSEIYFARLYQIAPQQ